MSSSGKDTSIIRIAPLSYIHVLDTNSNITRLEIGPQTFVRKEHETLIVGPKKMIKVPPQYYCEVENPVVRAPVTEEAAAGVATATKARPATRSRLGEVQFEPHGEVKLAFGDSEIRFAQDPFPLYPGELLKVDVTAQPVVTANSALRLKATLHIVEADGRVVHNAGDEWLFEGPGIYRPQRGVKVEESVEARVIMPGHALKLAARKEFTDRRGVARVTGETWLIKTPGAYMPDAYERVVESVEAYVLTEKTSLHMRAVKTFTDDFGVVRKNGAEWLITACETDTHIPNVYEEVVCEEEIVTLTSRQYCVVLDPVDAQVNGGKPQLGKKRLIRGERSFFLMPGERLEQGIQDVYILGENEGLILKCIEEYKDEEGGSVVRRPGDLWMIKGPLETVPPIQVEVITKRKAIAMDKNEGIYVKDVNTGMVRSVTGQTYMLTQNEELWAKELPEVVEGLLMSSKDPLADRSDRQTNAASASSSSGTPKTRDKTKVVTFRVPHNAAVQIYDYKEKSARVVFGPDLVMLGPDEHFTLLSLSGGKPKRPNAIKSLCLLLGPDFMTDIITVETADHARLSLQLSYNWHFKLPGAAATPTTQEAGDTQTAAKLFSVPDFVGDACKAMASRIRGYVAAVQFDDFHKNSARIIRTSVFGLDDKSQKVRDEFNFKQNGLYITSIDIQSVEPVDQRTREALQKSVQLAIEITTKSQEATARHEAERLEQEAKGRLDRQIIDDESAAENSRIRLLDLKAKSAAVESTGQAKAEAQSMAERLKIEGEAQVEQARLKAAATNIESQCELDRIKAARDAELSYVAKQNELEIARAEKLSQIETDRYKNMIGSIGTETLKAIALAGPDLEVRLLQSLGMKTTLITDGNSPINLFSTAHGLIGKALTGSSTSNTSGGGGSGGSAEAGGPSAMKHARLEDEYEDN